MTGGNTRNKVTGPPSSEGAPRDQSVLEGPLKRFLGVLKNSHGAYVRAQMVKCIKNMILQEKEIR